jgi:hypothetical protein
MITIGDGETVSQNKKQENIYLNASADYTIIRS